MTSATLPGHAIVTGASSGIGASIVALLTKSGWSVTGLSRRRPEFTDERFTWQACDLADLDELRRIATNAPAADAVVHAAGLQFSAPVGQLNHADGELMWRIHVAAAQVLVDATIDRMGDGGRILLMGSRTMTGVAGKSQYAATKAALVGFARSCASEVVGRAITVNVVAPGPTATPMLSDPARSATPPRTPPMGHLIDPAEVAATVEFLLSPAARSITGQTLVQCAGTSLS